MARYVLIGAGAVGVTFAAQLHAAGHRVVLVARGAQLDALQLGLLRYVRPGGERLLTCDAVAGPDELQLTEDDVLVLAVKSQDVDQVLTTWAWQPVQRRDGSIATAAATIAVLTTQNGLDTERSALRRFATVIGGVLWLPSSYVRAGEVVSLAAPAVGVLRIGGYPAGIPAVAETVAADLRDARFEVQVVDDIRRWKAAKLLTSVTFALDALYPPSELRQRASDLVRSEARSVLTAAGWDIADVASESTLDHARFVVREITGRAHEGNSTRQSLRRASSLESEYVNGEIVLLARNGGRDAPANRAILERIQLAARQGNTSRPLDDHDLLEVFAMLTDATTDVLIDAHTLNEQLSGANPPALLDIRWALGDVHGHKHYLDGHLPGAVFVDLETELAATGRPATEGRHPLPDLADLQDSARRWGIRPGQRVVVYDDSGALAAARAWWLLRWAGIEDVRILDGTLGAWTSAGLPLDTGEVAATPGDVVLEGGRLDVLDADAAAALAVDGVLIDARAGERYRGEIEPIDPRAGHIPGAVSAPTSANLRSGGRFADAVTLRARFDVLTTSDGTAVGVYCGSGVTAAHEIAALRIAGIDAALFAGSWSAWSSDETRPIATGPG